MLKQVFCIGLLCSPVGALAEQQLIDTYLTLISAKDMATSSGAILTDPSVMIQQDRANFHRFNRRDDLDEGDALYGDPANRAQIPQLIANGGGVPQYIADVIEMNGGVLLVVYTYSNGDRLTSIRMEVPG